MVNSVKGKGVLKSYSRAQGHTAGRPGLVGGSKPSSAFGMRSGLHTPEGQKAVIEYLQNETGMKFKPFGSVSRGNISKNDIDIAVVQPSQEEQEAAYLESLKLEGKIRDRYAAGEITFDQMMQELVGNPDENPIETALTKVGYKFARSADWLGIHVERYTNDQTHHSIEIWMPGDAGYPGSSKELQILKGGPGSGYHGHAGRPGEVGGSAPAHSRNTTLNDFESKHYMSANEWGMGLDKDGNSIYEAEGEEEFVTIPWEIAGQLKDGTWSHTHTQNLSFSMEDVWIAIQFDMAEMRATANNQGKMVTYSVKRPAKGWPTRESFTWNVQGTQSEMRASHPPATAPIGARSNWQNKFWQNVFNRLHIEYTVEEK